MRTDRPLKNAPITEALPAIFDHVAWGSDQVFEQTRVLAKQAGYQTSVLHPLGDIDRPEDLPLLAQYGIEAVSSVV